ncbi:MAG: thioredoxin domain-containing protein [Deltaproteobacteria bacterium]|nr:thioredoxin domain-containing protein [Deltaproteobacteria bacterium]
MSSEPTRRPDRLPHAALLALGGAFALLGLGTLLSGTEVAVLGGIVSLIAASAAVLTALMPRTGIVTTALLAGASGGYLFSRKLADATEGSLCSVSATFNCDAINSSPASELFGLPVSLIGLSFYLALALVALLPQRRETRFYQLLALFSIFSVAYSVALSGVMFSVGAVCIFCASMYAGNLILLLAGFAGLARQGRGALQDLPGLARSAPMTGLTLLFLTTLVTGALGWRAHGASGASSADGHQFVPEELQHLYAQPAGPVVTTGQEPVLGSPDAPYLVLEFADYQCPHCAHAFHDLPSFVAHHPEVQVRYRVFPLTGKCNPLIPADRGTEDRCRAAAAAWCAHQQGRFHDLARLLYANPGYFQPEDLNTMASQAGLDLGAFQSCVDLPATAAAVLRDATDGMNAGVRGTPTMFLRLPEQDDFIQITHGLRALDAVITAHREGVALLPALPLPPEAQ